MDEPAPRHEIAMPKSSGDADRLKRPDAALLDCDRCLCTAALYEYPVNPPRQFPVGSTIWFHVATFVTVPEATR